MNENIFRVNDDADLVDWNMHDRIASGYSGFGWYFWDETGAYCLGPFVNREVCEIEFKKYCEELG